MSDDGPREEFSRIGGHRALDLVNTVEWRLSEERFIEDLRDYDDVLRWAVQTEVLVPDRRDALAELARHSPKAAAAEAARVRTLRDALYATLFEDAAPDRVVAEYRDAVGAADLTEGPDGWRWEPPVDLALPRRAIAIDAYDLLSTTDLSRVAQCNDAECGWVFLDTSPRRNRRWCVAADCGNRNRARDFYRRSRADPAD